MFRKNKHDEAKTIAVAYIEKVQNKQGNLYDKAALMLYELTRIHAFESGNKRTAFLTTKKFVIKNEGKFNIPGSTDNVKVMIGIRKNYYLLDEIKEWIKNGQIKKLQMKNFEK